MGRDPHPFYAPPERFHGDRVRFDAQESHHILHVIRLEAGSVCRVVDGLGGRYLIRLLGGAGEVEGVVLESEPVEERRFVLELGFPLLRVRSRTDWLIEKGVEVGVDRFVPILWTRTVREAHSERNADRWRSLLREAMKQSERAWLPELDPARSPDCGGSGTQVILADSDGPEEPPIDRDTRAVRLLVGPEGGATDEERARLVGAGARLWALGPLRLRAETACVVGAFGLARAMRMAIAAD